MAEETPKEGAEAQPVEDPAEEATKARKKKMIMVIALASVLVLGIGGGAFFMLSKGGSKQEEPKAPEGEAKAEEHGAPAEAAAGKNDKEPKKDAKKDPKAKPEEGKKAEGKEGGSKDDGKAADAKKSSKSKVEDELDIDFGETFLFQPFHMNLGNPLENRYVRLEVSVEYKGGEGQKTELEKRLPQLRDAVVSIVSKKTREFLLAPDGKDQLRKEIKIRINRYMSKPVESVFITDLLIE